MFPDIRKITIAFCFLLSACGGGDGEGDAPATSAGSPTSSTPGPGPAGTPASPAAGAPALPRSIVAPSSPSAVTAPPASLGLDPYYGKYIDADGIAVVAAAAVDDRALIRLKHMVETMLAKRGDVRDALVAASSRFMIIPRAEGLTSLPEYAYLKNLPAPDGYESWDQRARGMGGLHTSCGEENLLQLPTDPYHGQDICIHEFAHTMLSTGLARVEPEFARQVDGHYNAIRQEAFIANTYMATSVHEYWAMAVQAWYDASVCRTVADGLYGPLCSHQSLGQLDPGGYELINRVFNPPPAAGL